MYLDHHQNHTIPAMPAKPAEPACITAAAIETLDDARELFRGLGDSCRSMVQGRDEVIALVLTAMFADGHVLLEDHPGSGKTTLAKTLGECLHRPDDDGHIVSSRRIQFTPDLLPSDVTGVTMFDAKANMFVFRPGPVFANVVLADEINRTSPKVQAALLEAMGEKQVTVDNQTHRLEPLFFVLATQNPLDLAGTYPLPRAQLDRFLFKIKMTYLNRQAELEVLSKWRDARRKPRRLEVTPDAVLAARQIIVDSVQVGSAVQECLVDIAQALRNDSRVALGVSTRSLIQAIPALQVWAMLQGRDFLSPRDVQQLAVPLFSHRLELAPGVKNPEDVVTECTAPIVEKATRRTLRK
jgi:MoxR-like ATPase